MKKVNLSVTQMDLAKELGMAQSSVQRALAGSSRISEKTRKKVLELVKKHNYRPNVLAQGLYRRRTKTLGVVFSRFSPNQMTVFGGVEEEANKRGYSTLLAISDSDIGNEHEKVQHLVDRAADAFILRSSDPGWNFYRQLAESGRPIIWLDTSTNPDFGVVVRRDIEHAIRTMTDYLIGLGHRRIGYITLDNPQISHMVMGGYRFALVEAGIPFDEQLVYYSQRIPQEHPGQDRVAVPENGAKGAEFLLGLQSRPTAIITDAGAMASGVMNVASRLGLNLPRDLSVATTDGGYLPPLLNPPLTEICLPYHEIGRLLADKAINQLEYPERPMERISLQHGKLVVRESTGPPCGSEN